MKPMQLLGDRILCRLIPDERSDGGIVIPEVSQNTATRRIAGVLAVGQGIRTESGFDCVPEVKVGDRVMLDYRGTFIVIEGEPLPLVGSDSVLAILETV